ncbi:mevalonate kinase [Nonomuraea solani]|uniref:mevalonate kinase n=1 Tax=Nonomuraea solani TaxID=1144553 RepID=A0A1H6ES35_9ACTN|nr:mevalonate kinase [Nonomuraea solani]SEG99755.1 mevalonate kinase [Nonomuraea solani]
MTTMTKSVGVGLAHGKAILLGEHTVVYGTPAIALPMAGLTVSAAARHGTRTAPRDDHIDATIEAAADAALRRRRAPAGIPHVEITCGIPLGRGLGSSAACATAAVRAVADLYDAYRESDALYDLVQHSERQVHGSASGVDARAVAADTPIWFEHGTARPLTFGRPAVFVVADTGVSGATGKAVACVREVLGADPARAERFLARARMLVCAAADAVVSGRLDVLGQRMLIFQDLLGELGVSTPAIDRLVAAALEAGAHGAKLTGGGLGGCVVALTGSADGVERLRAALREAGAVSTWTIAFGAGS